MIFLPRGGRTELAGRKKFIREVKNYERITIVCIELWRFKSHCTIE